MKKLAFCMELCRHAQGAPTHSLLDGTPAFKTAFLQDPNEQSLLVYNDTPAPQPIFGHKDCKIREQIRLCKSPWNSISRTILDNSYASLGKVLFLD